MTPTRGTPGTRPGPAALSLLVALALVVAACSTSVTRTPAPSTGSATPVPSGAPGPTDGSTGGPTEQPTDAATEPPTGSPSGAPTDTPAPSQGAAAACSGNDENRAFFAAVADGSPAAVLTRERVRSVFGVDVALTGAPGSVAPDAATAAATQAGAR